MSNNYSYNYGESMSDFCLEKDIKGYKMTPYLERNILVALLCTIYPAGIKKTAIEGWEPEWHNCVYIDFPWGQASWHYHDDDIHLFRNLPEYTGNWDGHTTEDKYKAIIGIVECSSH